MVQQFQALRCSECQTFQVHQSKKAKKWACKLCGTKQSYIKVYGEGTGAECRQHVQKLNMMRAEIDSRITMTSLRDDADTPPRTPHPSDATQEPEEQLPSSGTRWQQYLDDMPPDGKPEEVDDEGAFSHFTTDRTHFDAAHKTRRGKKRYQQDDCDGFRAPKQQKQRFGDDTGSEYTFQKSALKNPSHLESSQLHQNKMQVISEADVGYHEYPSQNSFEQKILSQSTSMKGSDETSSGHLSRFNNSGFSSAHDPGLGLFTSAKHVVPVQIPISKEPDSSELRQKPKIKPDSSKKVNNCSYRPAQNQTKKQQASTLSKWAQFVEETGGSDDDDDDEEDLYYDGADPADYFNDKSNFYSGGETSSSTQLHDAGEHTNEGHSAADIRCESQDDVMRHPDRTVKSCDERTNSDWTVRSHDEGSAPDWTVRSHGKGSAHDWTVRSHGEGSAPDWTVRSHGEGSASNWTSYSENIPPRVHPPADSVQHPSTIIDSSSERQSVSFPNPKANAADQKYTGFSVDDDLDALLDDF